MQIIKITAIWCSVCLAMKKTYKEIEKKYPSIKITELDYDLDEVSQYNPGDILPVTIIKNKNKEIRLIGEQTTNQIIEKINQLNE